MLHRLLASLLAACCLACVHVSGSVPPRGPAAASGRFLAGAARVDITPIPGIAMGGHSWIGRVGRGYWSRLHARAIYLEDADGRGLALVQCDLWGIAGGLSDRVAERLASDPALAPELRGRRLGREQIVLAATHTHQSPGSFSTDPFFASLSAPESGFDEQLFEFFAQRIAAAIAQAVEQARPARISASQGAVAGAFRNRSMEAFRRNPEADSILAENAALPLCEENAEYPDPEACRGIDPRVVTLRIDAESGSPIGAVVVFAAHPTLIHHLAEVYSADLHGAVALTLERRLAAAARAGERPVVAVFNGAEGDVSGRWTRQTRSDVLRVAGAIVDEVWPRLAPDAAAGGRRVEGAIGFRFERTKLRGQAVRDARLGNGRTAWFAMPGRASIAGAEDGRSGAWRALFREGKRGLDIGPHGPKVGAIDVVELFGLTVPPFWFTRLLTSLVPPPAQVGIGVYRLGPLRIAALPGEFTTVQGRRIARGLAPPGGTQDDVVLIGLAHDYAYYFTTPEEYDLQHYEGSSTLYGRWSGALLQSRLAHLAQRLEQGSDEARSYAFDYRTGPRRRSDTRRIDASPALLDAGTQPVEAAAPGDGAPPRPHFCWRDAAPRLGERATPRVAIEVREASQWRPLLRDGIPEDDGGLGFLTLAGRAESEEAEATCWCSHWLSAEEGAPAGAYRFSVETLGGQTRHSEAFALPATGLAAATEGRDGTPGCPITRGLETGRP